MAAAQWWIREVHNFGGFFGGDTVTLTVSPVLAGLPTDDETTLVIDEKAFSNIRDRHTVAPEMLLELQLAGERVERAELLAAQEWPVLYAALGDHPPSAPLAGPHLRAYHCPGCKLWVAGSPLAQLCRVCGTVVEILLPVGLELKGG